MLYISESLNLNPGHNVRFKDLIPAVNSERKIRYISGEGHKVVLMELEGVFEVKTMRGNVIPLLA